MKLNWYCLNQHFWKLGWMSWNMHESTRAACFPPQLSNPPVAGTEEVTCNGSWERCWAKRYRVRGARQQAARLYALGCLTWRDIWGESLSSPSMRNRLLPKVSWTYFMCRCGQMDGARGSLQRRSSSPRALGTGLSVHGGSMRDRRGQILPEAPQISIYSSFQVNFLAPRLLSFALGGGWWGNVHLKSLSLDSKYSVISEARITPFSVYLGLIFHVIG